MTEIKTAKITGDIIPDDPTILEWLDTYARENEGKSPNGLNKETAPNGTPWLKILIGLKARGLTPAKLQKRCKPKKRRDYKHKANRKPLADIGPLPDNTALAKWYNDYRQNNKGHMPPQLEVSPAGCTWANLIKRLREERKLSPKQLVKLYKISATELFEKSAAYIDEHALNPEKEDVYIAGRRTQTINEAFEIKTVTGIEDLLSVESCGSKNPKSYNDFLLATGLVNLTGVPNLKIAKQYANDSAITHSLRREIA